MKNVQRYERCDGYQFVSGAVTDSDGFMRDSPVVARTGIYLYLNADGTTRREYRPPSEVFAEDSLASFVGKPITVDHPKPGKVISANVRKFAIGTILSPGFRKDDSNVGCDIVIHDPAAFGKRRQLSLGYRCDLEEVPGTTPEGEPYDAIQHNIRINHLAVVKTARAGFKARLNMDGDENCQLEDEHMVTIKVDSQEFEVEQAVANYVSALTAKADAANAKADAAEIKLSTATTELTAVKADATAKQTKLDAMTAERDALKVKVDNAESEKADAVTKAIENTKKEVKERAEIEDACKKAKVEKTDGLDNNALRIAVIKAVRGDSFDAEGKSDSYIAAAYDFAVADLNKQDSGNAAQEQLRKFKTNQGNRADTKNDADTARGNMLQRIMKQDKEEK